MIKCINKDCPCGLYNSNENNNCLWYGNYFNKCPSYKPEEEKSELRKVYKKYCGDDTFRLIMIDRIISAIERNTKAIEELKK